MNKYYGKEDEQRKKVFDGQNTAYANELKIKRESISIVYDEEKLRSKLGDLWNYHLEAVNKEPPEMKMLFALVNECKICENYKQQAQEPCRFENPALSEGILEILSEKLGMEKESIFLILDSAPEGVVSIIISIVIRMF